MISKGNGFEHEQEDQKEKHGQEPVRGGRQAVDVFDLHAFQIPVLGQGGQVGGRALPASRDVRLPGCSPCPGKARSRLPEKHRPPARPDGDRRPPTLQTVFPQAWAASRMPMLINTANPSCT